MEAGRPSLVLDPLIGRDRELAALQEALASSRLVTVTGLGGVGKTRLALAEVERRSGLGASVVVVDLGAVSGAGDVAAAIADAMGVAESPDEELADAVAAAAQERASLLALDTFEHVLGARGVVADLLARTTTARLLVTSRLALGIEGETELRLGPLGAPTSAAALEEAPASRLFLQRARQLDRLRAPDAEDAEAIATVCRQLDGVPLAIELAAAWVRVLSPRAIARRLDEGRLVLERAGAGRSGGLERIVDATLELVDAGPRAAFDTLSVFATAFDETAAAAVTGADDPLPALRALESASLVRTLVEPDGEPRFALLDTIRAVAARRLAASPDAEAVRRRFMASSAARAQAAADRLRDVHPGTTLAWMTRDAPNLQAAYEVALAVPTPAIAVQLAMTMATLGVRSGNVRRSLRRLRAAMALGPVPPGIRSEALCAEINLVALIGEPADTRAMGEEAVALAREAGDGRREVRALLALAGHGRPPGADALVEQALELATAIGYEWGASVAIDNQVTSAMEDGRWAVGLELAQRSAARAEATGDLDALGSALGNVAELSLAVGRAADALEPAARAVDLTSRSWPESALMAWSLATLAKAEALTRHPAAAYADLVRACDVATLAEAEPGYEDVLECAATVLAGSHPGEAARALGRWEASVRTTRPRTARSPVVDAAAARLLTSLGRHRVDAERRRGAAMAVAECVALVRVTAAAASEVATRHQGVYGTLTAREQEVLALLARGRTDPEIARELGIGVKTASVHVANVKAKLGADNRVEVALLARELAGLGFLDDPGAGDRLAPR